jgi:hypothetical protein
LHKRCQQQHKGIQNGGTCGCRFYCLLVRQEAAAGERPFTAANLPLNIGLNFVLLVVL